MIRHISFSFHDTPEVLEKICAAYPWEFVQLQINYIDWELYRSREQYEIARRYSLPVIVMEPVRGGGLADLGPQANALLQKALPGASPASWALRWAAGLPGVLTVLSGMSSLAQAKENIQTFSPMIPLNPAQTQTLQHAKELYEKNAVIPCTNCNYCMPCPAGVDIPGSFALYNKCVFSEGWPMAEFLKQYAQLPAEKRGKNCVECGQCLPLCPQHIPIPQRLAQLEQGEKPQ